MGIKDSLEKVSKQALIKQVVKLLEKDSEKNVDRIFDLAKNTLKDEDLSRVNVVYEYYNNNKPTHDFIQDILKNTNKKCLEKIFTNFIANASWIGIPKRAKTMKDEEIKLPFVILLSPSMRCNLRCTGCYAANYSKADDIPFEEADRIIGEARDLGIYFFVILGGEPFFNEYMLDIYEKYNDCMFVPFTNGTLFNEKLSDKLVSLGNVIPMFSLEGFKEETDGRRGAGTFDKVMQGMDMLKERGVLFGVSSATSRNNVNTVSSDKYIDMLIEKGARMCWYFIFMPVGESPDVDLMLTPEQRIMLGRRTRDIRTSKPFFTIDFFNDAPYVGGCIAGKYYCHIDSHEDVEPCIFAHFAIDNLKNKNLIDVFRGPFFKELINRQPYNKNMLMPCMMIDNPDVVREVVAKVNAYPTDKGAEKMVKDKEFMVKMDKLAADFKPVADKAWKDDFHEKGNYGMSKG